MSKNPPFAQILLTVQIIGSEQIFDQIMKLVKYREDIKGISELIFIYLYLW